MNDDQQFDLGGRLEVFNYLYPGERLPALSKILGCTEISLRRALENILEGDTQLELEAAPGVGPDEMIRRCEFFNVLAAAKQPS